MAGNARDPGRTLVSKVSALLLAFAEGGTHTVTELAAYSGLPVSTTHRLATELVEWRVLERNDDRRFRPGVPLRNFGEAQCWCTTTIRDRAAPVLHDLARATGSDVRLGLLDHLRVAYIDKRPGGPVTQFTGFGTLPLHATASGKVLLAFGSSRLVDTLIRQGLSSYTTFTITNPDRLRFIIKTVRAVGSAISDRELDLRYGGVAAPVFGRSGEIIAAIEIKVDDMPAGIPTVSAALSVAAGSLSRELNRPCQQCTAHQQEPGWTIRPLTNNAPVPVATIQRSPRPHAEALLG